MADISKVKLNGTTYNLKDAAARASISNITGFNVEVISTFPTGNNIDIHTIYFKPKTGTTNDVYDEFMYINNAWEKIGSTAVDLSNYIQTGNNVSTLTNDAGYLTLSTLPIWDGTVV